MWSGEEPKEEETLIGYSQTQNDTVDPPHDQSEAHVQANPGGIFQSPDWSLAFRNGQNLRRR